jgi:cytochrome c
VKRAAAFLSLCVVAVAAMAYVHPFGNPRLELSRGLESLFLGANIPADAKHLLLEKCADCHSNETRWPVYSRVAPGSWLIERDIVEARKKLNFSNWNQLTPDTQDVLIGKMIFEAKSGHMPPTQYRLLQWDATLTPSDIATLAKMRIAGADGNGVIAQGDASRGKIVFEKRCTGCHAMEGDREGPRLAGIFGRKAGSVSGFDYSPGLRKSAIIWNEASLEKWLADPDMVVPDTKMDFQVPRAQERADLIAYFKR